MKGEAVDCGPEHLGYVKEGFAIKALRTHIGDAAQCSEDKDVS